MPLTPPDSRTRILIVDDDTDILDAFTMALEEKGYSVVTAHDRASLNDALQIPPDIILMDIVMPDINGIDLSFQLKLVEATQNIPIILMTASRLTGLDRVRAAYAHSILLKPLDFAELDAAIMRFLPPSRADLKDEKAPYQPYSETTDSAAPSYD